MPDSDPTVTFRDITELSDLAVTGELSLQETGRIVTSTATGTQRIIITSTAKDVVLFYSASTDETNPAVMGAGGTTGPFLNVQGPGTTDYPGGGASIMLYPNVIELRSRYGLSNSQLSVTTAGVTIGLGSVSTYAANLKVLTGTTQPSVGSGANARQMGLYSRMGSQVQAHVTVQWSSNGSAGNGVYTVSPPKSIHSSIIVGGSIGSGRVYDNSGTDTWLVDCRKAASTKVSMRISSLGVSNVTNANPFACGSSDDQFDLHLSYLTTQA